MNIGIIELHYHSEFLHTIIQLFKKEHLDVYLTRRVYNELPQESKDLDACFNFPTSSLKQSISTIPTQEFDLLFVNTIQPSMKDIPKWLPFNPKCKSILTLHNLNAWHNHKFIPRWSLLHSIDSYVASCFTSNILNKFDYLNVVYSPMFFKAKMYFKNQKVINIPYAYAQEYEEEKRQTINFVIPGVVSSKRRNYKPILEAFDVLQKTYDIRLILLGKNEDRLNFKIVYGEEDKILTFDNRISTELYEEYLREADFVVIPSVKTTHSVNVADEEYGFTKAPNIHEAYKWRKPLVIPYYIPCDINLTTSTISYQTTSDLISSVEKYLKDKKLLENIKKKAIKNTKPFLLENLRKQIYKELEVN